MKGTFVLGAIALSAASLAVDLGNVMCVGDSITAGAAAPPGYLGFLKNGLASDGYALNYVGQNGASPYLNEGHPGWGTWQIWQGSPSQPDQGNIDSWIAAEHPNLILLMIGSNDGGLPAQNQHDQFISMFNHIYADSPSVSVIWASIPKQNSALGHDQFCADFDALVHGLVTQEDGLGRDVTYCDQYDTLNPATDLTPLPDGVHPNAGGYAKLATSWKGAIEGRFAAVPEPAAALPLSLGVLALYQRKKKQV